MRPLHLRRVAGLALLGALGTACGGSSSPPTTTKTPPDLAAFLRLPVATPSSCPSGVSGSTAGRRSPWVGHVAVSVFVADGVNVAPRHSLYEALVHEPHVARV